MKTNYHFAKLNNHLPTYAQSPLRIVTHHHEEWDEEIYDFETGEPTGEMEHHERDWDTYETKIFPTVNDFLLMGWLPVIDVPPTPDEGCYVQKTGLADEIDGKIVMEYAQIPYPPSPPRVFSKLKMVAILTQKGVWENIKAYIDQVGLYDLYLAAVNFREDNEFFKSGRQQLQQALGWTDDEIEEVLTASVAD